jgi:hypothetical protein
MTHLPPWIGFSEASNQTNSLLNIADVILKTSGHLWR